MLFIALGYALLMVIHLLTFIYAYRKQRRRRVPHLFAYVRENYGLSLRKFPSQIQVSSGSSSSRVGGSEYTGRAKGTGRGRFGGGGGGARF